MFCMQLSCTDACGIFLKIKSNNIQTEERRETVEQFNKEIRILTEKRRETAEQFNKESGEKLQNRSIQRESGEKEKSEKNKNIINMT